MANNRYSGERLVSKNKYLEPMIVEDIARYAYFSKNINNNGYILDVGCGNGFGIQYLIEYEQIKFVGIDLSFTVLTGLKQNDKTASLDLSCMSAIHLGFPDNCFSNIISVEVLEHIKDVYQYLYEIKRVLSPNGIFMLTTPNGLLSSGNEKGLWPSHVKEYKPKELEEMLKECFCQVDVFGQWIPVYENNFIRKGVRLIAPLVKQILPNWLRVRALPLIQYFIKSELSINDIYFEHEDFYHCPTLVAICSK